jgi:CIC family chloride channel protein
MKHLYTRIIRSRSTRLYVIAVLLGLFSGAAVYVFRLAIALFTQLFNGFLADIVLSPLLGAASIIVTLALGGFIVGALMERFIGHERHHGVAGIMEAVALAGGKLRYRRLPFKALSGDLAYPLTLFIALGLIKIVVSAVSVEGGFVGGVFAPALFAGTMLGSAYGLLVNRFLPNVLNSDVPTYGIAGMAAMLAGVVRCPITAILLVFELTDDYRLILPIMLATVVCVIVVERIEPFGIYVRGLKRKGVHLPQGAEIDLLQTVRVRDVMLTPAPSITEHASLTDLRDALRRLQRRTLAVINDEGELVGVVTLSDLQRSFQPGNPTPTDVGSICTRQLITIPADERLQSAVRLLERQNIAGAPVLDPYTGALVGLFNRHSIVHAYNLALERKVSDEKAAQQVRLHHLTSLEVYQFRVQPSAPLAGRRVVEMQFPPETVVVAVDRDGRAFTPNGSTLISAGDWVTFVAPHGAGEALQQLTCDARG